MPHSGADADVDVPQNANNEMITMIGDSWRRNVYDYLLVNDYSLRFELIKCKTPRECDILEEARRIILKNIYIYFVNNKLIHFQFL